MTGNNETDTQQRKEQVVKCVKELDISPLGNERTIALMNHHMPVGIAVIYLQEAPQVAQANDAFFQILGYTRAEFEEKHGMQMQSLVYAQDWNELKKCVQSSVQQGDAFQMDVRLKTKSAGHEWFRLNGGADARKLQQAQICICVEPWRYKQPLIGRYQRSGRLDHAIDALGEHSFFDYDICAACARYSVGFAARLGIDEVMENFPQSMLEAGVVAADSAYLFDKERRYDATQENQEEEIHFILPDATDAWYICRYRMTLDANSQPCRILGEMIDITKQHVQIATLAEQIKRDPLTGLYNKRATEKLINSTIQKRRKNDQQFALMMIDLDDFKRTNDEKGHAHGDVVLMKVSEILKATFRAEDIVGRIGGDEFAVFLKNYQSRALLERKAQRVCAQVQASCLPHAQQPALSVSIGMAQFPTHGCTFAQLYHAADVALYRAKESGKNQFAMFDATEMV